MLHPLGSDPLPLHLSQAGKAKPHLRLSLASTLGGDSVAISPGTTYAVQVELYFAQPLHKLMLHAPRQQGSPSFHPFSAEAEGRPELRLAVLKDGAELSLLDTLSFHTKKADRRSYTEHDFKHGPLGVWLQERNLGRPEGPWYHCGVVYVRFNVRGRQTEQWSLRALVSLFDQIAQAQVPLTFHGGKRKADTLPSPSALAPTTLLHPRASPLVYSPPPHAAHASALPRGITARVNPPQRRTLEHTPPAPRPLLLSPVVPPDSPAPPTIVLPPHTQLMSTRSEVKRIFPTEACLYSLDQQIVFQINGKELQEHGGHLAVRLQSDFFDATIEATAEGRSANKRQQVSFTVAQLFDVGASMHLRPHDRVKCRVSFHCEGIHIAAWQRFTFTIGPSFAAATLPQSRSGITHKRPRLDEPDQVVRHEILGLTHSPEVRQHASPLVANWGDDTEEELLLWEDGSGGQARRPTGDGDNDGCSQGSQTQSEAAEEYAGDMDETQEEEEELLLHPVIITTTHASLAPPCPPRANRTALGDSAPSSPTSPLRPILPRLRSPPAPASASPQRHLLPCPRATIPPPPSSAPPSGGGSTASSPSRRLFED